MATILEFPAHPVPDWRRPASAADERADAELPVLAGRRCEYAPGDLARLLGLRDYAPRTIIDYLRAMARDEGLPLPKTPRLRGGRIVRGPDAIHRRSRWDAERVDAWLALRDGGDPCPPAAPALRTQLARRAAALAGGAA